MKNKINFLIVLLCLGISFSASAKKWRVNFALDVPTQVNFKELKEAVESPMVEHGDTIYVEGRSGDYEGGIMIKKKLIIIGPGYFLNDEDLLPTLCSHLPASIGGLSPITIDGSNSDVSGTVITGLSFSVFSGTINIIDATDITITRNKIAGKIHFPNTNLSSDIFITRNIISGNISSGVNVTINNLNIANNLILGDISMHISSEINMSTVRNNTFKETSDILIEGSIISYNYVGSIDCDPINILVENNNLNTFNDCYLNTNGNIFNPYSGNFDFIQDNWGFIDPNDNMSGYGAYNGNDPYYNNNTVSVANLPAWPVIYGCDIVSDGDSTLQVKFDVRTNN